MLLPRLSIVLLVASGMVSGSFQPESDKPQPTALKLQNPEFHKDVTYVARTSAAGDRPLQMNIAVPPDAQGKRFPVVLCIHGGGWQAGRREELDELAKLLAQRGFVAATISYRFAPEFKHPAQIQDCAEAVRFLRAHAAEYHLDPMRVGAAGFSAGAHLAMLLAVGDPGDGLGLEPAADGTPAKVQAAVSFAGPTNLAAADIPEQSVGIVAALIGRDPEGWKSRCDAASPLTYLDKNDSPMLLFNGTKDPLVPHTQAFTMIEAMGRVGVPGRIEIIAGAGHGFEGNELLRTLEATVSFFNERLKPATTK